MKKNQYLALLLAGTMAMTAFAGCSNSDSSSSTESGTASSTAAGSTATDGEKQVITVWTKDRHDATYIQGKIDEYNANNTNNVQVDYQLYTDNFDQAVDLAVQSDELPDILVLNDQVYNKYVNQGQWLDLYQYMDDDMKEYFKDEVYEGINEIDGKLYYIPTCGTTGRLIYNKEIFERVGISEPPTTMEEMLCISIEDDGEGYPEEILKQFQAGEKPKPSEDGTHLGLWSLWEMLRIMYDRNDLMELKNAEPHGTRTIFYLPKEAINETGKKTSEGDGV